MSRPLISSWRPLATLLLPLTLIVACEDPVTTIVDRHELVLDVEGCLGAPEAAEEEIGCGERLVDQVSEASPSGCLLLESLDDDVIYRLPLAWGAQGLNFVGAPSLPLETGQRFRAALYLYRRGEAAPPNCSEEAGLEERVACDESQPWCLIRLDQPPTAFARARTVFSFSSPEGACTFQGDGCGELSCEDG